MKLPQLLHNLVEKFTPMDELVKVNLQTQAQASYDKIVAKLLEFDKMNEAIEKNNKANIDVPDFIPSPIRPYPIQLKVISFIHSWIAQYLFAIAYIWLVPVIKNYISGNSGGHGSEDDLVDEDEYENYKEFQRFKKSMR